MAGEVKTRDFANDEEVRDLVRAFEAATIAPAEFAHTGHIAVALSYLETEPLEQALVRMRNSLVHFTQQHGTRVYHETVTRFWMKLLHHLAAMHGRELPLWRRINSITARLNATKPLQVHYSQAILRSEMARANWVEPDQLPLAF